MGVRFPTNLILPVSNTRGCEDVRDSHRNFRIQEAVEQASAIGALMAVRRDGGTRCP